MAGVNSTFFKEMAGCLAEIEPRIKSKELLARRARKEEEWLWSEINSCYDGL